MSRRECGIIEIGQAGVYSGTKCALTKIECPLKSVGSNALGGRFVTDTLEQVHPGNKDTIEAKTKAYANRLKARCPLGQPATEVADIPKSIPPTLPDTAAIILAANVPSLLQTD